MLTKVLDVVWHHKATELTYSIISSCYIPWERRVLNPCTWSAWGRMGVQQGQRNASSAAHRWPEENRKQLIRSMIAENRACLFWKSSLARLQEFTGRNSSICLYEIKRKNLFKSTCPTGSFTCPGPSGSGKRWALWKCSHSCVQRHIGTVKPLI